MKYKVIESIRKLREEAAHVWQMAREATSAADRERLVHQAEDLEKEADRLQKPGH